jgi:hypothetical protein
MLSGEVVTPHPPALRFVRAVDLPLPKSDVSDFGHSILIELG